MGRLFDMDNGFFRIMTRIADLMILNIIFLFTCIPIVTIGAAWTALYYMTLKMVRNEESYIIRGYFKSFKENFKQATAMWMIILVFLILLWIDFRILNVAEGALYNIVRIGLMMVSIICFMILTYLFPILAKFYNSIRRTFINAFLMSVRHLPQTIIMLFITVAAVVVTSLNTTTLGYGLLVWIVLGFALIALINSYFLVRVFDNYIPNEDEQNETEQPVESLTPPQE